MTGLTDSEANEICKPSLEPTKGFQLRHAMYHIKDPRKSLNFYSKILGMSLLLKMDSCERKCSVFYMGYEDPANFPKCMMERKSLALSKTPTVELFHWWGTENDAAKTYIVDGHGYGHIGILVPDIDAACNRLEKLGVEFTKKLNEGMDGMAYINDPDGYSIEIFNAERMAADEKC